jgi:outer membrane scaffolding protein for murein synthesis (MipA/OmpV family)
LPLFARLLSAAACLVVTAAAIPLAAQERPAARVTIGFGGAVAPEYLGSAKVAIAPAGIFAIQELVLPGGLGIGSDAALPTDPGFGLRGGFRYIPKRDSKEFSELAGLSDIDPAFELGLGLVSITQRSRVFVEVRKGFAGHDGWVGEAGADLLLRPSDRLVLAAGPRAYFGDDTFVQTYFGVTSDDAARSSLAAFEPDGGLVSLGLEVNARHYFADHWSLVGTLGWRRLQGDAARSPITDEGSADQFRARLVVTRTFSLGR